MNAVFWIPARDRASFWCVRHSRHDSLYRCLPQHRPAGRGCYGAEPGVSPTSRSTASTSRCK